MALWQWDFDLVPKAEVLKYVPGLPSSFDQEFFDSINWWSGYSRTRLFGLFDGILARHDPPEAQSSRSWGSYDEDRIVLGLENGLLADIEVRVDLRNLNYPMLNSIVDIAKKEEFLFYVPESGRVLEPILTEVLNEIQNSRKMSFVLDPAKFFADKDYLERINRQVQGDIESGEKFPSDK